MSNAYASKWVIAASKGQESPKTLSFNQILRYSELVLYFTTTPMK